MEEFLSIGFALSTCRISVRRPHYLLERVVGYDIERLEDQTPSLIRYEEVNIGIMNTLHECDIISV